MLSINNTTMIDIVNFLVENLHDDLASSLIIRAQQNTSLLCH